MTASVTRTPQTHQLSGATGATKIDLRTLNVLLARIPKGSESATVATERALQVFVDLTDAVFAAYYNCRAGRLAPLPECQVPAHDHAVLSGEKWVYQLSSLAVQNAAAQFARLREGDIAICIPIETSDSRSEALTAVFRTADDRVSSLLQTMQVFAAYMGQWRGRKHDGNGRLLHHDHREFLDAVLLQPVTVSLKEVGIQYAEQIRKQLKAKYASLANYSTRRGRLLALAPNTAFDSKSELAQIFDAVAREARLAGQADPTKGNVDLNQDPTHAVAQLLNLTDCKTAHAIFLRNGEGALVGASIVVGTLDLPDPTLVEFISCILGNQFALQRRAAGSIIDFCLHRAKPVLKGCKPWTIVAACLLLLIILLCPVPLKIKSDCVVEPLEKRFIAAPFDGMLEEVLFAPGDFVNQNEVIARMDAREIELQLATIDKDFSKAKKERDRSMVDGETSTAQLAELEMQRLHLNRDVLERLIENLELKSPTSGVVISGDLKKLEGSRLQMGQTLAEIGPLNQMIFEVAVLDEDISHVEGGQQVTVQLDALPGRTFEGHINRLRPRSEHRNHKNVFIAEVVVQADEARDLRPGMSGRAKIIGNRHVLGWNLFHKAWDRILYRLGW